MDQMEDQNEVCSKCGSTENLVDVKLYGGEDLVACNDCLGLEYTGCATCNAFFRNAEDLHLVMRDENAGDVVCIFCAPQKFVNACTSLTELRDTLNLIAEVGADDGNLVDYCNLPTFGGKMPGSTKEVFSWDVTRTLEECGKWRVEDRCEHCGEASIHCKCGCQ